MDRLLQLFTLEKAFYELRYELGNRPDWVPVPLGGILALTGRAGPVAPCGSLSVHWRYRHENESDA
jgi:maltose alpha-D-glucosyltransferase/alpha-amylase